MLGFLTALIVTLIAGIIALVVWKVCTIVKDRREYARFENQVSQTKNLHMSPLYKSPKTTHKNPLFTFEPDRSSGTIIQQDNSNLTEDQRAFVTQTSIISQNSESTVSHSSTAQRSSNGQQSVVVQRSISRTNQ